MVRFRITVHGKPVATPPSSAPEEVGSHDWIQGCKYFPYQFICNYHLFSTYQKCWSLSLWMCVVWCISGSLQIFVYLSQLFQCPPPTQALRSPLCPEPWPLCPSLGPPDWDSIQSLLGTLSCWSAISILRLVIVSQQAVNSCICIIQYFGHGVRCKVFSVLCSTWILKFFMFESVSGSGAEVFECTGVKKRKKGSLDHSSAATCTAVILRTAFLWHGLMSTVVSSTTVVYF